MAEPIFKIIKTIKAMLMTKLLTQIIWLLGAVLFFGSIGGCTNSGSNPGNEPLIRVRDRVLTVLEFDKAFEITRSSYPQDFKEEPEDLKNAQLSLLNQLTVEMIILERAEDLGLSISNLEIDKAVSDIKSDYPEDTFEKTLLKSAVSFESWEARLKNRLLMQKVVDTELKDQIVITPEDIARYYEQNFKARAPEAESEDRSNDINELMIKYLRREKAEQAYKKWIIQLKGNYSIEINTVQWEKITGSQYRPDKNSEVVDLTPKPD